MENYCGFPCLEELSSKEKMNRKNLKKQQQNTHTNKPLLPLFSSQKIHLTNKMKTSQQTHLLKQIFLKTHFLVIRTNEERRHT